MKPRLSPNHKRRLQAAKKTVSAHHKRVTTTVHSRLRFVTVWKLAAVARLSRIGASIVRVSPPWLRKIGSIVWTPFRALGRRINLLRVRRPHRSFKLTRRRDYKRSLRLPGYWAFTSIVFKMLWKYKKIFGSLILLYAVFYAAVAGFGAQDAYTRLSDALKAAGGDVFSGAWGQIGQASLLLFTTFTTGLNPTPTEAQGILTTFLSFLVWLTVIWLLRNLMAGHNVRLRDGIYSSGSPIISTMLVGLVMMAQLLPIALLILIYNAATSSGLIDGGVEAMLFWTVAVLLIVMTLYWLTSSLIGLVIVTLPGMYPLQAIKTAGDLVVGRRLRVLYRLLWMVVTVIVAWLVIAVPIVIFDSWFKSVAPAVSWVPLVPIVIILMSAVTVVWTSSYVYLLYRRIVDDDASPA